jgi:endonuclease YncB( thermonuclease family)
MFCATIAKIGWITGAALAIDGGTLHIEDLYCVRLAGIDAPEVTQTCERRGAPYACGAEAAGHLMRLISAEEVNCKVLGRQKDHYTAECDVAGMDLGALMVAAGWALDRGGRYSAYEMGAKLGGFGLWEGTFMPPAEWRAQQR